MALICALVIAKSEGIPIREDSDRVPTRPTEGATTEGSDRVPTRPTEGATTEGSDRVPTRSTRGSRLNTTQSRITDVQEGSASIDTPDINVPEGSDKTPTNGSYRGTKTHIIPCPSGWGGTNCAYRRRHLKFYVRYGSNLPDTDGFLKGDSDPYTRIYAYDSDGNYIALNTGVDQGDESPEWYDWLDYGTDTWTQFAIKVYDSDIGSDDSLSNWQYVTITTGSHTYFTHYCYSGYIKYDYYFCLPGWEGPGCTYQNRNLKFYIRYGTGLPDTDGWLAGDSDPYVKVIAYDRYGNSVSKTSDWLYFGTATWYRFAIKVYDSDPGSDDSLSNWQYVNLYSGSHTFLTHNCNSGYIKYDYYFV